MPATTTKAQSPSSPNTIVTMASSIHDQDVFIVASGRTPMGGLLGSLSSLSAIELGRLAVQGTLARTTVRVDEINELIFGNVVSAGTGQNPARQVCVVAGLPNTIPCTTVNKVCSSGLKAVSLGAQSIRAGDNHVVVAGGTESMSQAPHLMRKLRTGAKYGNAELVDALVCDGLSDAFDKFPMGVAAEHTNTKFNVSRDAQDDFAVQSYTRAVNAANLNLYTEIIPVHVMDGKVQKSVSVDDEISNYAPSKMRTLRPVFDKAGSITAANASPISDGAAALVLVSGSKLKAMMAESRVSSQTPVFKIHACADAEQEPILFTTTPSIALMSALAKANLTLSQLDAVELNEAFACVALANLMLLPDLDPAKVNILGGAVALGHPLGASGARILTTLMTVLSLHNGRFGAAAICNGGGGATACVIERISLNITPENHL